MNIRNIKNVPVLKEAGNMQKRFAQSISKFEQLGEGANISFDFAGKAMVVLAIIMVLSKEDKEKKGYSALKHTVAATIQLILEIPVLYFGSKYLTKLANNGRLDKDGDEFSYNEKAARENFIKTLKETKENSGDLIEQLNKNGLTRKIKDELEGVVEEIDSASLKTSFEKLKVTDKRLFHMNNRVCFAVALFLTPTLCALENWAHPKIMKLFQKTQTPLKIQHFSHFLNKAKGFR